MRAALFRGALFAVGWWALVSGGPSVGADAVALGAVAVLAATAASLALLRPSGRGLRPSGLAGFAWFFVRESLIGGVDIAMRALSRRPSERTREVFFTHRTALRPGPERALLVGTIGLLPGTVATAAAGSEVRVHVLDRELARPEKIAALERKIAAIAKTRSRVDS